MPSIADLSFTAKPILAAVETPGKLSDCPQSHIIGMKDTSSSFLAHIVLQYVILLRSS